VGLIINPVVYYVLAKALPSLAFLDRMALSFFCVLVVMTIITVIKPLKEPVKLPTNTNINLESSSTAKIFGVVIVALTLALYAYFW
ncbi:MAG: hypothetical protein KAS23_16960, partial [Anaerohalosphaera sp.]|nr:hypothetical protein [Anaerohalosphaera sp.]